MIKFRQKLSNPERKPTYGATPNKVYSYYDMSKRRSSSSEPRRASKKKSLNLQKFLVFRWLIVASAVALISFLIYASTDPIMRIADSEILIEEQSVYAESAKNQIDSSIFSRTKITFDYVEFEKKLKEKHPEIATVNTSYALIGSRPVVRLTFHKPALLVTSLGRTWVVDDRGVAISKYKESQSKLPKLIDEIGVAIEEGDSLVSSDDVEFITKLQEVATGKNIIIDKFTTPVIPKQLDVRVVGEPYYTKFNLNEDPAGQIGAWLVARENLATLNQVPAEYLDMRAEEKVYWK